jgi:glycosyltransferase involved in cell wall biosynthesis
VTVASGDLAPAGPERVPRLRTLVYTDYAYHRDGDRVFSERAFSIFLACVAEALDGPTVILGRLSPPGSSGHYPIGERVEFVGLPFYRSLASPAAVLALPRSLLRAWRAVGDVDRVWALGPHPLAIALALFARLRRKQLVLGVRQDSPAYIRSRHPHNRLLHLVADLLERAFRGLAHRCRVVVVGPELAQHYQHAGGLLEIAVSLVSADQIVDVEEAAAKDYQGTKTILSVGRLDAEKNPAALVAALAELVRRGGDWRLEVCGEGPLLVRLEHAVEEAGLGDRVELAGYVPIDGGLLGRYRRAHVLLHSSLTEGLPQILLEAFAAGLPVVASEVGGIGAAVGDCVRLIPPGDTNAAAEALEQVAADPALRRRLIEAGHDYVAAHTLALESQRVARFLREDGDG